MTKVGKFSALLVVMIIFVCTLVVRSSGSALASAGKYKMTTETPKQIVIPSKLETRIGTLEFFDGLPSKDTVQKAYDFLDFQRAVNVFLEEIARGFHGGSS